MWPDLKILLDPDPASNGATALMEPPVAKPPEPAAPAAEPTLDHRGVDPKDFKVFDDWARGKTPEAASAPEKPAAKPDPAKQPKTGEAAGAQESAGATPEYKFGSKTWTDPDLAVDAVLRAMQRLDPDAAERAIAMASKIEDRDAAFEKVQSLFRDVQSDHDRHGQPPVKEPQAQPKTVPAPQPADGAATTAEYTAYYRKELGEVMKECDKADVELNVNGDHQPGKGPIASAFRRFLNIIDAYSQESVETAISRINEQYKPRIDSIESALPDGDAQEFLDEYHRADGHPTPQYDNHRDLYAEDFATFVADAKRAAREAGQPLDRATLQGKRWRNFAAGKAKIVSLERILEMRATADREGAAGEPKNGADKSSLLGKPGADPSSKKAKPAFIPKNAASATPTSPTRGANVFPLGKRKNRTLLEEIGESLGFK